MVLFSKFGKTVKDLFKYDKYELNRTVSVKCKSDNTEWSAECIMPLQEGGHTSEKAVYTQIDPSFGTIKFEIPNIKPKKIDYQLPKLKDGLKVNLEVAEEKSKDYELTTVGGYWGAKFTLKGEYEQDHLAGKLTAVAGNDLSLQAEFAHEVTEGCWVGGEVRYVAEKDMDYHVGLHAPIGNVMVDARADIRKQKVNLKLHNKYSDNGAVAAEFDYDVQDQKTSSKVGGAWQLDEKCNAQGYIKHNGNTYLLLKYKLSENLTASAGTSFDLNKIKQDGLNLHWKINIEA